MTLPEMLGTLGILVGLIAGIVSGIVLGLGWWTVGTAFLGVVAGWFGGVLLAPTLDEHLAKQGVTDENEKKTEQEN